MRKQKKKDLRTDKNPYIHSRPGKEQKTRNCIQTKKNKT